MHRGQVSDGWLYCHHAPIVKRQEGKQTAPTALPPFLMVKPGPKASEILIKVSHNTWLMSGIFPGTCFTPCIYLAYIVQVTAILYYLQSVGVIYMLEYYISTLGYLFRFLLGSVSCRTPLTALTRVPAMSTMSGAVSPHIRTVTPLLCLHQRRLLLALVTNKDIRIKYYRMIQDKSYPGVRRGGENHL